MAENQERAVLAGGCFWGMQDLLRKVSGVHATRVGYTGGTTKNATYKTVKTGTTGHAESLEILFDPSLVSYTKILEWFFQIHDPTTKNRQGNDRGSQYRSAIFYTSDEQRTIANDVTASVNASGKWPGSVVTELVEAGFFWEAEEEHQDYLEKYPTGYTCHYVRPDWALNDSAA